MSLLNQVYEVTRNQIAPNRKEVAIWILERLIEETDEYAEAHHELGLLYFELNKPDKAQENFEKAVSIDPENPSFAKDLGDFFHVVRKDARLALEKYMTVLEKQPNDQDTLLKAGHLHMAYRQFASAKQCYSRLLTLDPNYDLVRPFLEKLEAMPETARIRQYKDKHIGQRCVIIGNGPSLKKMDLSFLTKEITFGLNKIYLLFDKWNFTPTYYVSVNPLVLEQSYEIIQNLSSTKFISVKGKQYFKNHNDILFLKSIETPSFTKDPHSGLWEGHTVTYVALQLAFYMGFEEVILIGVDHNFICSGNPNQEVVSTGDDINHFHPDYFGEGVRWNLPDLKMSEMAFRMAKKTFENSGRRIIDATVDGKLDVFQKMDYKALFNKYHTIDREMETENCSMIHYSNKKSIITKNKSVNNALKENIPNKHIILLTLHRSGSTWLMDAIRTHPDVYIEPRAILHEYTNLKGNRYPGDLCNGPDALLNIEVRPGVVCKIPALGSEQELSPLRHRLSENVYAIEKIHSEFFEFNSKKFISEIETIEKDKKFNFKFILLIRDPKSVISSFVKYKRRNPHWYKHIKEEKVPDFICCEYQNLLEFSKLKSCLIVEYDELVNNFEEALKKIFMFLWPGRDSLTLQKVIMNAKIHTGRNKRVKLEKTPFLGDQVGAVKGGDLDLFSYFYAHSEKVTGCYDIYYKLRQKTSIEPSISNQKIKLSAAKTTKPNFIGIGAAKAGTTTIAKLLSDHPDISIPRQKELHYFDEKYDSFNVNWYYGQFDENAATGEFTPSYLFVPECRDRIYDTLGKQIKLIVSLRNPIDRAFSHYCHAVNNWNDKRYQKLGYPIEDLTFEDALEKEEERLQKGEYHIRHLSYFNKGLYAKQLKWYFEKFPKENFFIYILEDFEQKPRYILRKICQFLGVNDEHEFSGVKIKLNSQTNKKLSLATYDTLYRRYEKSIIELESLLNRNLSIWKR